MHISNNKKTDYEKRNNRTSSSINNSCISFHFKRFSKMNRIDLHEKAIKTLNLISQFESKRDNLQQWCDKYLELFPKQKEDHELEIYSCNVAIKRLTESYNRICKMLCEN